MRTPLAAIRGAVVVGLVAASVRIVASLTPAQVGDLAPAGAPDGVVDDADVAAVLKAVAGDLALDAAATERADAAPVAAIAGASGVPLRVRPNPNPVGPLDVGDAVVIARRAAGRIAFDRVNQPPVATLEGDGAIVSIPAYQARGRVTDDNPLAGGAVEPSLAGAALAPLPLAPGATPLDVPFTATVALVRGGNELTARARDADGRWGAPSGVVRVTLDDVAPRLRILAPLEGEPVRTLTADLSGTVTDESAVTVTANGVPGALLPPDLWGARVELQSEDENVVTVVARDGAVPPNETRLTRVVVRDTTPPAVTTDPLPDAVSTRLVTVSGTVADRWGVASVMVGTQRAAVAWDAALRRGRFTAEVPVLDGPNAWEVVATDLAGNVARATVDADGDFAPPTVTLASAATVGRTPATVKLAFSEPVTVSALGPRAYDPPLASTATSLEVPGVALVEGANVLAVSMRDLAGNVATGSVTVTLDTLPPVVRITAVRNPAFRWVPAGGLENVVTNAPAAIVEGSVTDAGGGLKVVVGGYEATVDAVAGTFTVAGVPLVPRANVLSAVATDAGGNSASTSVTVRRDAEGPVVALDFPRAAYVSTKTPAPAPFDAATRPARYVRSDADVRVTASVSDPFYVNEVSAVAVKLDGAPLAVNGAAPYGSFDFTLPAAALRVRGLHLLEVTATDALGNDTVDVQAMLGGEWVRPTLPIPNAVGLVVGPGALDALEPLLEAQVAGLNGDLNPDVVQSVLGATLTIYGIALCQPPGNPSLPPYPCNNNANVDLSLTSTGRVGITLTIPYLHVGTRTSLRVLFVTTTRDGYISASPATVRLEATFVNTASGVELQAVPGTVQVTLGALTIRTGIGIVDGAASLLSGIIKPIVENTFAGQVTTLLSSVNTVLQNPLFTDARTGRELKVARASNDATGLRLWLDAKGNPCPNAAAFTNIANDATPAAGDTKPCPPDSPRLAPGSYAGTLNADATTLPAMDLRAPDNSAVSAEAAANDEFVNYILHEQWAMGAFDLKIDPAFLGASSPISLDTESLSLFVPDFKRPDVAAVVPLGSGVAVQTKMVLPPVVFGRTGSAVPAYDLRIGEMEWQFLADADGLAANGFEAPLFKASVHIRAPADVALVPAANDLADDQVRLTLGRPVIDTDVVSNPYVVNEASIRSAIGQLVDLALPSLTGGLTTVALPQNTARFRQARVEGAGTDFLVLSGALVQTVTVSGPAAGATVTSPTVTVTGTVDGLTNSGPATVAFALPGDSATRAATVTARPDANSLAFSFAVPASALSDGANVVKVVSTDGGGAKAATTLTLTKAAGGVTRAASSGCGGCDGAGGATTLLAGLGLLVRRRRDSRSVKASSLRNAALALAASLLAACGGCGEDKAGVVVFTGPAVQPDPVFLVSALRIGEADEGFDVDRDSPNGDEDPDNALTALAPLANEPLGKAVAEGSVLLLVQVKGLTRLPAPGESGAFDAVAFVGVDADKDPSDNLSGSETFRKSPTSFDANGQPLIVFPRVRVGADAAGTITLEGGPATFRLSVPLQGSMLSLSLSPTYIRATIGTSALRADGLEAKDGLLGGVIPAGPLATPIEGLPFSPISVLAASIDVDLNQDGKLDRSPKAENPDGISAGIVFSAVPAYLSDEPVNRPPVVALEPLPAVVKSPSLEVKGSFVDADGDCTKAKLSIAVGGAEAAAPLPTAAEGGGCAFAATVRLPVGDVKVRATATDEAGDAGSAEASTRFVDETPPVLVLESPTGNVQKAEQVVRGKATDDAGIAAVQLDVAGTMVAVPAEAIAADGSFAATVTLPALGANVITGRAKDLGENLSEPSTLALFLDDVDAPVPVFAAASTSSERVEGAGPWDLDERAVTLEGAVSDNAGLAALTGTVSVDGGAPVPLAHDPVEGTFRAALSLERGSHAVRVVFTDASGNAGVVEGTVRIADERGPQVVVESPAPLVRDPLLTLSLRVTDDWDAADLLSVTASVGAEPLAPVPYDAASGTFARPVELLVGANALVVEARDTAGNLTRLEGAVELVDETPPALEVTGPAEEPYTLATSATVTGTASDNVGRPRVEVELGGTTYPAPLAPDGGFSVTVPLAMGPNELVVRAVDSAGLVTQRTLRLVRRDPDEVATLELAAAPDVVVAGNDTVVTLAATLTRLAGGPVPDGTQVAFEVGAPDLGTLSSPVGVALGGVANVTFRAGRTAGTAAFTAWAQGLSDAASLAIAAPTSVGVDVCVAEGRKVAGASWELGLVPNASFTVGEPGNDAVEGLGGAEGFHAYNRPALPTRAVVAGVDEVTGAPGGTAYWRVTWPLRTGFAAAGELTLTDARVSDLDGRTTDGAGVLAVCGVEHLVGSLPPRVAIAPVPAQAAQAALVLSGTVTAADLAGCTATVSLNGQAAPLDVSTGAFSVPLTLAPGANVVRVVVTDAEGRQGADEAQVRYVAPNLAPTVTITGPPTTVAAAAATVTGAVSDPDDGLAGLTVSVRVGTAAPVPAVVDAQAGTYRAQVTLAPGANAITVTATDARGLSATASQTTQLVTPNPAPRLTLTAPADGLSTTATSVSVAGRVDEGGNAATIRVTMTVNGASAPVAFSPFTRELTATAALQAGTNVITVTATDALAQSAVVSRRVDVTTPDTPPRLTIVSPTAGAQFVSASVTLRGTVRDDKPLSQLRSLKVNGVDATVDAAAGTWTATVPVTPGSRALAAEVVDERGQAASASVTVQVISPVLVVSRIAIGGPSDGFNVDSTPLHPLSDAAPDNALSGLASIANQPLQDAVDGRSGSPLILLFELVGLGQLPAPGQSATADIVGYVGQDGDTDPADNFSGTESFTIDPASYDAAGQPLIKFSRVVVTNDFGTLKLDTFPSNPANFQLGISGTTPPLVLQTRPAYLRTSITVRGDGLRIEPGLLGGVVPASTLAVPITVGTLSVVPLQLILSSNPSNPVPDVDLNGDGTVNTTNATSTNPDGVSVGITFTAVSGRITR